MTDDHAALAQFQGVARLFPLPNLVLFPQVDQGLHIFEPRYRQMIADALATDQLITLVLLKQGWEEEYDDTPAIEAVGCLGRIVQHQHLPDGRYNVRLRGIGRVRLLEELRTDKLYRTARAEPIPDVVPDDLPRLTRLRKHLAETVLPQFELGSAAHDQLLDIFQGDLPLGPLCDLLSYALPFPLELKQQLLEQPHVEARAELIARELDVPPTPAPVASGRKFPPDFSTN